MPESLAAAADATPAEAPPRLDGLVTVQLELPQADAERLRALGGSGWLRRQLAAAPADAGAAAPGAPSDYLLQLAQALFPLPVHGAAVPLVDALRKQRWIEAAVTYGGHGEDDRAIVTDITSLGRAEIERLRGLTLAR